MENNADAILEGLNSEQKAAVSCVEGPVLIVAGAGSGKTRVLTSRIAYMLEAGCQPEQILALTFTKKAATQMKERISLMVGEKKARRLYMGTFHSVFIRFLREFADRIGYPSTFTIYDTGDSVSALKTCIKELQLDDKLYKPKDILGRISMAKNNLVTPEAYKANPNAIANDVRAKKPRICDLYALYAQKCKQAGVMDFDDILLNMNILLRDDKEALQSISERFSHILVDEYQDTNFSQYLILRRLSHQHRNICVVGDDSQSIYAFRGAKIENILNFQKDYPECHIFRLEKNYRSTRTIVDAANSLIANNENRIPKTCVAVGDQGERIRLSKAYTEQEEGLIIASSIIERMREEHAMYQDFAILYRTNSQSRAIEEALRKRNLPYMIYSGNSFFDRAEVKDMMAYFKLAVNPNDDESFKRVVNTPARGIGDTSMAALTAAARAHATSLFKAAFLDDLEEFGLKNAAVQKIKAFCEMIDKAAGRVQTADVYEIATYLSDSSGLYLSYKVDNSIESQSRASNIEELINSVASFREEKQKSFAEDSEAYGGPVYGEASEVSDEAASDEDSGAPDGPAADAMPVEPPTVTLPQFLEEISLLSNADIEDEDGDSSNKIALMTVHSAKGLEFPYVFVAGMEENLFPSGSMLSSENDIEEERRLFYVALTRAKRAVCLTFAKTRMRNGKHESNSPSRFIREIDRQYIANPLHEDDFEDSSSDNTSPFFSHGFGGGGFRSASSASSASSGFSRFGRTPNDSGISALHSGRSSSAPSRSVGPGRFSGPTSFSPRPGRTPSGPSGAVPALPSGIGSAARPVSHSAADFSPSPISSLATGMRIEHNRFGFGKIMAMDGDGENKRAKILFDNFGEKMLILKYAKVRIV